MNPRSSDRPFRLQLRWRDGEGYRVQRLDGARARGEFPFPLAEEELLHLRQGLEAASYRSLGAESRASRHGRPSTRMIEQWQPIMPQEIGRRLSAALLTGEVGERFRVEQEIASNTKEIRCGVILQLDPTVPELARLMALPWELIVDPVDDDFLLPDRRWPLIRSVDIRWSHMARPPATESLKLLVLSAQPRGLPRLAAEEEIRKIQEACQPGDRIRVEVLEKATAEDLRHRLEDADLLHYIGHGSSDPSTGTGSLALEDRQGERRDLGARELSRLCRDLPRLRLVTLNACDTAVVTGEGLSLNPFAGVATALIQQGVPAVIAMQWTLSDPAGIRFGEALYRNLARSGDLLEAVEAGRHAIHIAEQGSLEWATPVLYLHNQAEVRLLADVAPTETSSGWQPPAAPTPSTEKHRRPRWIGVVAALLLVIATAPWTGPPLVDVFQEILWPAANEPYRLRIVPVDREGTPVSDTELSTAGSVVSQRVDNEWELVISPEAVPENRILTVKVTKESASLSGQAEISLSENHDFRQQITLIQGVGPSPLPPPPSTKVAVPLQAVVAGRVAIVAIDRDSGKFDRDVTLAIETVLSDALTLSTFIPQIGTAEKDYIQRLADGDLSQLPGDGQTPWGAEYLLVSTVSRKALPQSAAHLEGVALTLKSQLIAANRPAITQRVSETNTGIGVSLDVALTQAAERCLAEIIATLNGGKINENET